MPTIRVELPAHLRTLAHISGHEVRVEVAGTPTVCAALDALEAAYPMLLGTIRDHGTQQRRAFLRFFACQQDISHDAPDAPLPAAVAEAREPLIILGAVAGGLPSLEVTWQENTRSKEPPPHGLFRRKANAR
jgi:molybdopterin synthase sulfur carrier subunit